MVVTPCHHHHVRFHSNRPPPVFLPNLHTLGENFRKFSPISVSIRLKVLGNSTQHVRGNSAVDSQLSGNPSPGAFDPRKALQKISDFLFLSRQRSHRLATP